MERLLGMRVKALWNRMVVLGSLGGVLRMPIDTPGQTH
jgi:hypothetical protein